MTTQEKILVCETILLATFDTVSDNGRYAMKVSAALETGARALATFYTKITGEEMTWERAGNICNIFELPSIAKKKLGIWPIDSLKKHSSSKGIIGFRAV